VQGYNIKWGKFWGLTTFGESYHNNHHAFPGSANIGINKGKNK
jgi:fatty-acid desaturase